MPLRMACVLQSVIFHCAGFAEGGATLRIYLVDNWPSSGKFVVSGQNNATATLPALNNTSYQVDIDTNGDGTSNSTVTGYWADL